MPIYLSGTQELFVNPAWFGSLNCRSDLDDYGGGLGSEGRLRGVRQ